jgi:hypothetical protein
VVVRSPSGKITLEGRSTVIQDLRVRYIFYGRALRLGFVFSFVLSITLVTAVVLLVVVMNYLGVFSGVEPIFNSLGWDVVPSTKLIWLSVGALILTIILSVEISILIFLYMFNMASAITGGIILKLELLEANAK